MPPGSEVLFSKRHTLLEDKSQRKAMGLRIWRHWGISEKVNLKIHAFACPGGVAYVCVVVGVDIYLHLPAACCVL